MSTMSIDAGAPVRTVGGTPTRRPVRDRRAGQGSGRATAPMLRPGRSMPAPELRRAAPVGARGCDVPLRPLPAPRRVTRPLAAAPVRSAVRLTERGIAVVLVTGMMIAVAALTVVGATAARVTSDGYQPGPASLSSNR